MSVKLMLNKFRSSGSIEDPLETNQSFYKYGYRTGLKNPDSYPEICKQRKQKLVETSAAEIARLNQAGTNLAERKCALEQEIRQKETGKLRSQIRGRVYLCIALVLFAAAYASLHISIEPFEAGPLMTIIFALIGAFGAAACMAAYLDHRNDPEEIVVYRFAIVGLTVLMFAQVCMGMVRADLLSNATLKEAEPSVQYENDQQVNQTQDGQRTEAVKDVLRLLKIALPFFGIGAELGSGLLLYLAMFHLIDPLRKQKRDLVKVNASTEKLVWQLTYQSRLPEIFEKDFTAGAIQATTEIHETTEQKQGRWIMYIIVPAILLAIFVTHACGAEAGIIPPLDSKEYPLKNIIFLIDLSSSRNGPSLDGETEFQKDARFIASQLSGIPPGTHVSVIGITDNSFGKPAILLRAQIASKPGPLNVKISSARKSLVNEWLAKSRKLQPKFETTDLFGALATVQQIVEGSPGRTVLFVLSDMQQDDNAAFDFDKAKSIHIESVAKAEEQELIGKLRDFEVYCMGTTPGKKSLPYWNSLRLFWTEYFNRARAVLVRFTISRDSLFAKQGGLQ